MLTWAEYGKRYGGPTWRCCGVGKDGETSSAMTQYGARAEVAAERYAADTIDPTAYSDHEVIVRVVAENGDSVDVTVRIAYEPTFRAEIN